MGFEPQTQPIRHPTPLSEPRSPHVDHTYIAAFWHLRALYNALSFMIVLSKYALWSNIQCIPSIKLLSVEKETTLDPCGPSSLTDTKPPDGCAVGKAKLILEAGQDLPLELLHSVTI